MVKFVWKFAPNIGFVETDEAEYWSNSAKQYSASL